MVESVCFYFTSFSFYKKGNRKFVREIVNNDEDYVTD